MDHANTGILQYFEGGQAAQSGWTGQLRPAFQAAMARHFAQFEAADADFYHTIRAPDGTVYAGAWDLSGRESLYLGGLDCSGRRVIEFGPASGSLTAYLAAQGASLVVFDLPPGRGPEIIPYYGMDFAAATRSGIESMTRLRNSWWFAKRVLGFTAEAVYGDIYDLPDDLGGFDVSVFGAILLHLSNPFRALQAAAALTRDAIVVTDVLNAPRTGSGDALMLFNPTLPPQDVVTWWGLSPDVIRRMLWLLGFTHASVTTHEAPMNGVTAQMFTVTARRHAP